MDDLERFVGRIEEFKENTQNNFASLHNRLDKIDEKLEDHSSFKWRVIGGATLFSTLVTFIAQFFYWSMKR